MDRWNELSAKLKDRQKDAFLIELEIKIRGTNGDLETRLVQIRTEIENIREQLEPLSFRYYVWYSEECFNPTLNQRYRQRIENVFTAPIDCQVDTFLNPPPYPAYYRELVETIYNYLAQGLNRPEIHGIRRL